MTMEPTFRIAEAGDADALLSMMRELNEHEGMAFDEPKARAALAQLFADERFGVAHLILFGEEPAGYLVVTFGFSIEFGGRDAFVDELFIKDEFRGRGVGKAALGRAERSAARAAYARSTSKSSAPTNAPRPSTASRASKTTTATS